MKISAKTKDCRLIVKVKASFRESFDEKALDAFARGYLRGFLKPKLVKKNLIEYTGPVGISLCERLKRPITKREFLFIMEQVVLAVQKVHSNHLSLNRLLLDTRCCYINDVTKELQFIYVPTVNEQDNRGVIAFMSSIIYSVIPAAEKDTEFVSRFVYFLKNLEGFSPEMVERFIEKEDRSVVNTIKKHNAGQSGFMTSKQKSYYEYYDKKRDDNGDATALLEENDEATGILNEEDEATGLLGAEYADEATGLLNEAEDECTGLLNESENESIGQFYADEDEATGLLTVEPANIPEEDEQEGTALLVETNVHYPSLLRVLTEETICVNKPVFRIGKERSYVDYFVTNNNAVSRSHADIITRGTKYFVIDLNSKNHTYINNQMLAVHCETEIRNGDRLKLGNEEFIFNV